MKETENFSKSNVEEGGEKKKKGTSFAQYNTVGSDEINASKLGSTICT